MAINVTLGDDGVDVSFEKIDFVAHATKHESGGTDTISLENLPITGDIDVDGNSILDNGTTIYDSGTGELQSAVFDENSITINAGNALNGGGEISLGGSTTLDVPTNSISLDELDLNISPDWEGNHTFNGGLELGSTLDASGNSLINLPEPTADSHATRKEYVDAVAQGLAIKDPAEAATTADIDLSSSSDPNPIDGHTLVDGERVLLKAQSDNTENGIYVATTATDPTTWVRAGDFDESGEVTEGAFVFIENGSTNGNASFVVTSGDPHTIGSSPITFSVFSRAGDLQAGFGLDKVGQTFSVDESFEPTWTGQHVFAGGVSLQSDVEVNGYTFTEVRDFETIGGGSDSITIRDSANAQDLAVFNEGGPIQFNTAVDFSNGDIDGISRITIQNAGETYGAGGNWWFNPYDSGGNLLGSSHALSYNQSGEYWEIGRDVRIFSDGLVDLIGGKIQYGTDRGAITGLDMEVTSTPTAGTQQSYSFDIDGNEIAKVFAEADGTGGIQNETFDLNAELRFLGTDRISANGTDRINFGGGFITLLTGGSGSDIVNIKDTANGQDLAVFNEGGNVEIPNGDLTIDTVSSGSGTTAVFDGSNTLVKASSSRRYKENIEQYDEDWQKVYDLEPAEFDFIDTGTHDFGYIAEEVEKIAPELVVYDNEGRPDGLKYDRLVVHLLELLKDEHERNNDLEERMDRLEEIVERGGSKRSLFSRFTGGI